MRTANVIQQVAFRHSRWWQVGVVAVIAILFAAPVFGQFPEAVQIAKSVVKISVKRPAGKSVGTGFAWSKPTYVVTALHVIAGAKDNDVTVYVQSPSPDGSRVIEKSSAVTILKVHLGADLALLELTENLGLIPLKVASANLSQDHEIWGFPRAIPEMKSDRVRFSKGVTSKPTFAAFFETPTAFEKQVGGDGFPKYDSQILRVSDIIQPGHSGAPIIDAAGQVVGIGDGGLYEGTKRINWAIPAAVYMPALETSRETPPAKPSVRETRFSFVAEKGSTPKDIKLDSGSGEKQLATKEPVVEETTKEETILHWAWSASLAEILSTADEEDQKNFQEIKKDAREKSGDDLSRAIVNVYEDYETGATVAAPEGVSFTYDEQARILEAWSESQQVKMIVQIITNDSWEAGVQTKDKFAAYIEPRAGDGEWQEDPDMPDEEPYNDEDEVLWFWDKSRIMTNEDGDLVGQYFASFDIDGNDFLGTAVFAHDLHKMSDEDLKTFYLMMACVDLAGFAIE